MSNMRPLAGMLKRSVISLSMCIAFLLHASHAAAVVIYDEAIDGDFSDVEFASTVGALSNGVNTVLGSSSFDKPSGRNGTPFTWDRDHFTFSLSDTATVSFQYMVTSLTQTNSSIGVDFRIFDALRISSPANPGFFTPLTNGASYGISAVVLTAGTYEMFAEAASLGFGGSGRVDWTYSWDMTVAGLPTSASIPEPTSLALLGLGIVGLGLSRKRSIK